MLDSVDFGSWPRLLIANLILKIKKKSVINTDRLMVAEISLEVTWEYLEFEILVNPTVSWFGP